MAYCVFTLPVHDPGAAETELNGLLASHRQQLGGTESDAANKPAF